MNGAFAWEHSQLANTRLAELYSRHLESWRGLKRNEPGLSIPMFLQASPAYFSVRPRLMFVGQETHGWWKECQIPGDRLTVGEIMDFYTKMKHWLHENYRPSPYWDAIRRIAEGLNIANDAYLISNIFPCDVNERRAPEVLLETMRAWRLLPQELEILQPELVIFFIGPVYAFNLGAYFEKSLQPHLSTKNCIQSYRTKKGSWEGWVTYHPNALRRLKLGRVIDELLEKITERNEQAGGLPEP